ncbi:hypothetical protein IB292_21915 [Vibrio parahaemolyticus]|uniref:Uncharacterized protein n=1 Tax=Vibrio parahaemolyticus TaxID=670 RepID=A0A9Q3UHG3_VIBPH|nr:hypothetical protein [Vibrio parahaemolyticus]MCC3807680.1 hypothetical protein [Vibrio parahaemolyticus]
MILEFFKKIWNKCIRYSFTQTEEWQLSLLNQINLETPKFYAPSADGELLVHWELIFQSVPSLYRDYFNQLIVERTETVEHFDFGLIDSLCASKSFGRTHWNCINGSWFHSVSAWGAGMYPTHDGLDIDMYCNQSLAGLDQSDWVENISHIKREGFRKDGIIVHHYDWLGRYECINSGGSHHAAMLIHQIRTQKLSYTRKAIVTYYSLNLEPLYQFLECGYLAFVTTPKCYFAPYGDDSLLLRHVLNGYFCQNVYDVGLRGCTPNGATIVIMNKSDLKISLNVFEKWYNRQIKIGKIIPLIDLLSNTLKYCVTPYNHKLDSIYLGDPLRRSDIKLREIISKLVNDN